MLTIVATQGLGALSTGTAFADLSFWRKVAVAGSDSRAWLNDLISADISDLEPGAARHSLLLSPTGRVRAAFTVTVVDDMFVLVQDPQQPRSIEDLLIPYVLSSHVVLEDRTEAHSLFAFPGRTDPLRDAGPGAVVSSPSCLGPEGIDVIGPAGHHDHLLESLAAHATPVGNEAVEAWRIGAAIPRFGVDGMEEDLPQEAGLDERVAFDKGCYLGQEAVAKVRNLGHPRRILLALTADGVVASGAAVEHGGRRVGRVSSAAARDGRTDLLARIAWDARGGPWRTDRGTDLAVRPVQSPV